MQLCGTVNISSYRQYVSRAHDESDGMVTTAARYMMMGFLGCVTGLILSFLFFDERTGSEQGHTTAKEKCWLCYSRISVIWFSDCILR